MGVTGAAEDMPDRGDQVPPLSRRRDPRSGAQVGQRARPGPGCWADDRRRRPRRAGRPQLVLRRSDRRPRPAPPRPPARTGRRSPPRSRRAARPWPTGSRCPPLSPPSSSSSPQRPCWCWRPGAAAGRPVRRGDPADHHRRHRGGAAGDRVGAWTGGRVADRRDPRRLLAPALVLAGVATALTLPVVRWAGEAAARRRRRVGDPAAACARGVPARRAAVRGHPAGGQAPARRPAPDRHGGRPAVRHRHAGRDRGHPRHRLRPGRRAAQQRRSCSGTGGRCRGRGSLVGGYRPADRRPA